MFYKQNGIVAGILLLILFAGAIGLVSVQMDKTVNRMHYSVVEEMGEYRTELIRQDFQKTAELVESMQDYLATRGYQKEQFEELIALLVRQDNNAEDSTYYWTLYGRQGEVALGIDIALDHLHAYFSNLLPAGKNYAYILNDSGVIVAHPEEKWLGMRLLDSLERRRVKQVVGENKRIHVTGFSQFLLLPVDKIYYPLTVGTEKCTVVINVVQLDNQEAMADFHRYALWIVVFTVVIFIVLLAYSQRRWRKEYDLRQKAEQEAIRLNLQQLKNQLNPHFLFNALNSLSALITTDPGVARKFILEMSKVYRYVLEKRKENLSKLEEEVEFIRHYYFLQKIRFGEQLNLHLADNLTTVNGRIPAMSLQLIFENALKYNEITHRYPLDIDIYAEVGAVIVENSYHPRTDMPEASFGVGMESIQEIYRYYADVQPEYEIKEGKFICRLPLVE